MLKPPKEALYDQYSDKSGKELVKIASRLKDEKLAKLAINTLFGMERPFRKIASFPSSTAKDVFLSRIYFEGQREKIAEEIAEGIDQRLCIAEELHSISNPISFKSQNEKIAAPAAIELLPLCKIASKTELFQAGQDFSRDFEKLSSKDRGIFARNFVKTAQALDVEIPDTIKIYACVDVEARPDILDNVLLRKVAMEGVGQDSSGFAALYEDLRKVDLPSLKISELYKLAQCLDEADNFYALRETFRGKTIPDAWQSVFMAKKAEEVANKIDVAGMSKAEIISRYGEGALEEVEDGEGEIDRVKLEALVKTFGGGREGNNSAADSGLENPSTTLSTK